MRRTLLRRLRKLREKLQKRWHWWPQKRVRTKRWFIPGGIASEPGKARTVEVCTTTVEASARTRTFLSCIFLIWSCREQNFGSFVLNRDVDLFWCTVAKINKESRAISFTWDKIIQQILMLLARSPSYDGSEIRHNMVRGKVLNWSSWKGKPASGAMGQPILHRPGYSWIEKWRSRLGSLIKVGIAAVFSINLF